MVTEKEIENLRKQHLSYVEIFNILKEKEIKNEKTKALKTAGKENSNKTHNIRIEIPDKEWKYLWNRKLFKGEKIKDYITKLLQREQQNTK